MPDAVDITSIKFNDDSAGFTSKYIIESPPLGDLCNLPALTPLVVPILSQDMNSLDSTCKFQFPTIIPPPPIFIPVVPILCPSVAYCGGSSVSFVGLGQAADGVGGSLEIVQNPDNPCCSSIQGSIIVNVPPLKCPNGISFSGSCPVNFVGNIGGTATQQVLDLGMKTDDGCNFYLGGCKTITLPTVPCPNGSHFSSNVSIGVGQGTTQAPISIGITGGPCDFSITGGGIINIPCPQGMSFKGSVAFNVEYGNALSTLDSNNNPGPISVQMTGGPCNYQITGGGTIIIPSPDSSSNSAEPGNIMDCELLSELGDSISIDDIIVTSGGITTINIPQSNCTSCHVEDEGPFTMVNPTMNTVYVQYVKPAASPCCSDSSPYTHWDLCSAELENYAVGTGDYSTLTGEDLTFVSGSGGDQVTTINDHYVNIIDTSTTDSAYLANNELKFDSPSGTIDINMVDVYTYNPGDSIKFQPLMICYDGNPMQVLVLCGNPFTPP